MFKIAYKLCKSALQSPLIRVDFTLESTKEIDCMRDLMAFRFSKERMKEAIYFHL